MEERSIEEIAAEDRWEMYRLNEISHVAHNVHNERDRCITRVHRPIAMGLDPLVRACLHREVATGDSFVPHAVGRVHCHLEDVAYQLGLPIDGEAMSGCLWDFKNMMPEGTGRPRWDWFREMFGEPPNAPDADACIVTFSWLRSRFRVLPSHPSDEMVLKHARAYIWILLSIEMANGAI
ncbi:hypothetical protein PIB30_046962 [Stylosanthes scabra]|uniref:Uncharacterized protein n=1 Tax=Stylosanthes scabra TaxID=79078 RepID=A0ABU6SGG6_9FABA|nr:hypothetical protein [Stylosanthes scabra]